MLPISRDYFGLRIFPTTIFSCLRRKLLAAAYTNSERVSHTNIRFKTILSWKFWTTKNLFSTGCLSTFGRVEISVENMSAQDDALGDLSLQSARSWGSDVSLAIDLDFWPHFKFFLRMEKNIMLIFKAQKSNET